MALSSLLALSHIEWVRQSDGKKDQLGSGL
jgi:hypothetical protein